MGLTGGATLAGPAPRLRRVLIEQYDGGLDLRHGGGVEMASLHLSRALEAHGIAVEFYADKHFFDAPAVDARLARDDVDAILPLVESPLFVRPDTDGRPGRRSRVIRLWHDVTRIAPPWEAVPCCPIHAGGTGPDDRCHSTVIPAADRALNVFLCNEAWTRCFGRRQIIPWAVDHLPSRGYRASDGPVLLLAGKIPLDDLIRVVRTCDAAAVPTRVVFSNWTQGGQRAKQYFAADGPKPGREVIDYYDIEREHARVFGGISAALVLSRYNETFNFLAAEAVHFGIPVVALPQSGATLRFASAVADLDGVLDLVRSGRFRRLGALPRPTWRWRDVAAAYESLLDRMEDGRDEPPHLAAAYQPATDRRSPCHT